MSLSRFPKLLLPLGLMAAVLFLAACGSDDSDSTSDEGGDSTVALSDCTPDSLETVSGGKLTVATDDPAFEPYFVDNDPTNGEGFESAVAYAIADKLGYSADDVEWTVVPFNSSYAPGPKDFDFDVNQISITPDRASQVDFSAPYYTADQAVIVTGDSDFADAASLADLADAKFGVQIGTTSKDALEASVEPNEEPQVFDTSNDVVSALENGQVDAIVVDTPTALFLTAVKIKDGSIVGEFAAPEGDEWGALLQKDSPLTDCVSAAVEDLKSSGELDEIQQKWINAGGGVATLE